MRINRIEGFQPYDQYVEHRFDRSYGLIESLGARFSRVIAREADLRQQLQTAEAVRRQGEIRDIQRLAEYTIFGVLTSEALSALLSRASGENPRAVPWIVAFSFAIGGGIAIRKHLGKAYRWTAQKITRRVPVKSLIRTKRPEPTEEPGSSSNFPEPK